MDFRNQRLLFSEAAQEARILLIGAGAINSFVALGLAKMGCKNIEIWDGDTIEPHNIANQMFPLSFVGKNKAEAVAEMCSMFSDVKVTAIPMFFESFKNNKHFNVVVIGVDSMKARRELFDSLEGTSYQTQYIDARMGGQFFRVFSVDGSLDEMAKYKKTLHTDEQASPERCGQKSIIYTVFGVASQVCNYVRRAAEGLETTKEENFDYNVPAVMSEEVAQLAD